MECELSLRMCGPIVCHTLLAATKRFSGGCFPFSPDPEQSTAVDPNGTDSHSLKEGCPLSPGLASSAVRRL